MESMTTNGTNGKKAKTERKAAQVTPSPNERAKKKFCIRGTFGVELGYEMEADGVTPMLDAAGKQIEKNHTVTGYVEPGPETPAIDDGYVFPSEETKTVLMGLELKDRILLVGGTGCGKSSLVEQIAARLNYNVVKINFDGAITRNDLIGEVTVKPNANGQGSYTEFQPGILPYAFTMPGTIVLLDEWDTISGECAFVLQRPLEKNDGKLLILENGGQLISLHPDNCIVATANTCGMGDDTGLYTQGTKVQNYSQLNRFGMTVKIDYLPEDKEIEMIHKRFPQLSDEECNCLVKAVNLVREGYKEGQISVPLSHRDLINWCDKYIRTSDPIRAATYCFLNRMPNTDAEAAKQLIKRVIADNFDSKK